MSRGAAQDAPDQFFMTFERPEYGRVIELNGYGARPIGRREIRERAPTNRIACAAGCHVRVEPEHRENPTTFL